MNHQGQKISDEVLKVHVPAKINLEAFYPLEYPRSTENVKKDDDETWIVIPGEVQQRRKDLLGSIEMMKMSIQQNKNIAEQKLDLDAEKLNFEGEKLQQKDDMDKEKLQSQEDQADLRAEVTLQGQRGRDGTRS